MKRIILFAIAFALLTSLANAWEYKTLKAGAIICQDKKTCVIIEDVRNDENLLGQVRARLTVNPDYGRIIKCKRRHQIVIHSQDGDMVEVTLRSIPGYYWTFKEFVE